MAYQINFTDSVNKGSIEVIDNDINQDTSLRLPGRNTTNFGEAVLTNFLHLLENFADNNPPDNPVEGQLWYDNTSQNDVLKVYDGTNWVSAGGLKKGTTEPDISNSVLGDIWVNTGTQQLYIYSGSGWILVGPEIAGGINTGAKAVVITDTDNTDRQAIINYVDNVAVSIIVGAQFTPKILIPGFGILYPGINVSTNITGTVGRFKGIADKAEQLLVNGNPVDGNKFTRNDEATITSFPFTVRTNDGLEIGNTRTIALEVEGTTAIISQAQSNGFFDLRTNNEGTQITPIRIKNNGNVGISTADPNEALDVTGNIKNTGNIVSAGTLTVSGAATLNDNLTIAGSLSLSGSLTTDNVFPDEAGITNIGTNANKFNNIFANKFTGALVGDVTGNVTGSAGSTGKLTSATSFSMTGEVSSTNTIVFDGQTGGLTKVFNTQINQPFVADKTAVTTPDSADEILINRPGTGLRKITQNNLIANIPIIPVGTMVPYAGLTAPTGWFICDGSEKSLLDYILLATAIGYDAADNNTWYWGTSSNPATFFVIPDLRGRFPTGISNGLSGPNRLISDPAIGQLGGVGGEENITLDVNNLPEHKHTLTSDDGDTYYALSKVDNSAETDVDVYNQEISSTAASGITKTGGVDNPTLASSVDITPPYVAINYIIYHGVLV
jgi:microcystin-dependent protein